MSADKVEWFIRSAFIASGIVNTLPVAGMLGRAALERAYGITLAQGQLVTLMQHRAVLFGIVAVSCFIAALHVAWRAPAGLAALTSMLSFVLLAALGERNAEITRILWVDVAVSTWLAAALAAHVTRSA